MDVIKMLVDLKEERDRIDETIVVIERLAAGGAKRRGRPPKWMQEIRGEEKGAEKKSKTKTPRKRRFSAATRRKMAKSQRRRWATAHKEAKV